MNTQELNFLLRKYKIDPRKEQGQNFLVDQSAVQASIDAAELTKADTVLEIGPGFGSLTTEIAEHAGRVVAVEQDRILYKAITELAQRYTNIQIHNQDIRTFHLAEHGLEDRAYKLVANLPYSITSWILRQFMEQRPRPSRMVVMIQKEVAERLVAPAGKTSLLSVATQLLTTPEIVRIVHGDSFVPAPKVDSAIVRLDIHDTYTAEEVQSVLRIARIGFSSRRKQLHNNLAAGLQKESAEIKRTIAAAGLPETARPQELSVSQWVELAKQL